MSLSNLNFYLPARNKYIPSGTMSDMESTSMEEEIRRYVKEEFPVQPGACNIYSVPRHCIQRQEVQASRAESLVFQHFKGLNIPGLWLVFFQGSCYAGKTFRKETNCGKLMIREHDYVLLTTYNGVQRVTLVEVKSTCDAKSDGFIVSDARTIKNNKRTAQHQLRDHIDILCNDLELGKRKLDCHIFWPFLSSNTKDPQDNEIPRWRDDKNLHVFKDSFFSQVAFSDWFKKNVLHSANIIQEGKWNLILQRFIILSCGAFVDEIHQGMLALLSQEQVSLLNLKPLQCGQPVIIHGAAGTGKTLLILRKLQQLHEEGNLHENARALYICYWPGICCDVKQKLWTLGLGPFVDTVRYFISSSTLSHHKQCGYKHIFMDETEVTCLSFDENILTETFQQIFQLYQMGNTTDEPGTLWFVEDSNQTSLFLPKRMLTMLKTPDIVLTKVIRSTCTIYKIFDQFYSEPLSTSLTATRHKPTLSIGHNISGPPIYWINSKEATSYLDTLVSVIIDLCSTKGIKPNDLCVLPYLTNNYRVDEINQIIQGHFVQGGFMPQGVSDVERFLTSRKANNFLVPWVLRVKGLEFKVVIMVLDDEDFDFHDEMDRRKFYIMASRCTCLLVLICPETLRDMVDLNKAIQNYPFSLSLV